jgi:hypothetical protein
MASSLPVQKNASVILYVPKFDRPTFLAFRLASDPTGYNRRTSPVFLFSTHTTFVLPVNGVEK